MQMMLNAMTSSRNNLRSWCVSNMHDYFSALAIPVGTRESWKHDAPRFLFRLGVMETLRQWCSMWTTYKQTQTLFAEK